MNLALQYLKTDNYKFALQKVKESTLWPKSLGAGAPYPDMINNSLEDDIQKLINQTKEGQKLSMKDFDIYQAKVMAITNKGR